MSAPEENPLNAPQPKMDPPSEHQPKVDPLHNSPPPAAAHLKRKASSKLTAEKTRSPPAAATVAATVPPSDGDDDASKVIFSGKIIYNKLPTLCTLTQQKFTIVREPKSASIPLAEIFAVHYDNKDRFSVFQYVRVTGKKFVHDFWCERHEECQQWVVLLRSIVFCAPVSVSPDSNGDDFNKRRRLLVILNPFAGTKKARKEFEKLAKPILDVAHLTYEVRETEHANHASEIARTFKLSDFTEIASCGGDGILNEVLNGLMQREDWQQAIKIPIIPVPCGTSNAIATVAGAISVELAAFILARGFYQPFDVFSSFQNGKRTYGMLSITWAAIADADHGTENLRFLGGFRNTIGALKAILGMKYYEGALKYLEIQNPVKGNAHKPNRKSIFAGNPILSKPKILLKSPECPMIEQYFQKEIQMLNLVPLLQKNEEQQVNVSRKSSSSKLVVEESQQVVLKEITDKFFAFVATNVTHLAYDFKLAPSAHISNGHLDLLMLRKKNKKPASFFQILKAFAEVEHGTHLEHYPDLFDELHTRAFYLEPLNVGSFVSVDGEVQKYEPTLVEVHPSLGNIFYL